MCALEFAGSSPRGRTVNRHLDGVTESEFKANEMLQNAVIRQIQVLGEATKRVSTKLTNEHDNVPWRDIAGMRDKLVHDYFEVDVDTVWLTEVEDLQPLSVMRARILDEI